LRKERKKGLAKKKGGVSGIFVRGSRKNGGAKRRGGRIVKKEFMRKRS